ncbi:MAG: hypothetical protein NTZ34_03000 [Chloroflexi bacterium]|nr:hypothetical protein [Chloroflexota bacterium]
MPVNLGKQQGWPCRNFYSRNNGPPFVAIVSKGEPLFSLDYVSLVFDKIKAPSKEILVFNLPCHLIFNEYVNEVLDPIADKIREYADRQTIFSLLQPPCC